MKMILYKMIETLLLIVLLTAMSISDYRSFKIPSKLNEAFFCLGIIHIGVYHISIISSIYGFFSMNLILFFFYILSKGQSIGGGDIKLLSISGLFLGWKYNILSFYIASILVLIFFPIRSFLFPNRKQIAFAPYLSVGILLCYMYFI